MEISFLEIAAIALGLLARIGIPIALTAIFAVFLKWLDKRWQNEAAADAARSAVWAAKPVAERPPCWEIHNCPPALRKNCQAFAHPETPCWEVFRTNGQLKPACRSCKVPPPEVIDTLVFT